MLENFNHHPRLMDETGRMQLPPSRWHPKVGDRYPIGSSVELFRRADNFFYRGLAQIHGNLEHMDLFRMQPIPELIDIVENPVDIIACALVDRRNQKAVLIMEDHLSQQESSYTYGKSTIMRHLIHLQPIDVVLRKALYIPSNEKISAQELFDRLNQIDMIREDQVAQTDLGVLTGDMTYIGRLSGDILVTLAPVGSKEDFIWDAARSAMRNLVTHFDSKDPSHTLAQIELARKLNIDENIWMNLNKFYPVGDIIFLKPNPALSEPFEWENSITQTDDILFNLREQLLRNPIYLSKQAEYWAINSGQHRSLIEMLTNNGFSRIPTIRCLQIRDPRNPQDLELAAKDIEKIFDYI